MEKTFKESNRRWIKARRSEIKKEIAETKKAVKKLLREEVDHPTTGKAHSFRAATYNRYMKQIESLTNELSEL